MNDRQSHFLYLLKRFEDKTASPEEVETLFEYLNDASNDVVTQAFLETKMSEYIPLQEDIDYWRRRFSGKQLPHKVISPVAESEFEPVPSGRRVHLLPRIIRYAAAILIILVPVAYFYFIHDTKNGLLSSDKSQKQTTRQNDIAPGGNKAVLTLSDGSSIILDSTSSGILANQAGTKVKKVADGSILYVSENSRLATAVVYNTMTTPRGGQYQLILSDGTKVWLNAASSITYPTSFAGNERRVSTTGEVYFEVAKNAEMPFKVNIGKDAEINVLGTHFNVNAYSDEASINTTLLEGSLDVNSNGNSQRLLPGQQAQVGESHIKLVSDINTEQVTAWKNGAFSFNKDNLSAVLRQISRWYDVEIIYEKNVPDRVFSGKMGKNLALSQILKFLKDINVNLKVEGNKIIVMK